MQTRHFSHAAQAQMSHTAIEVTLKQLQLHQLFDDALDCLWRDAILLPDCVVTLVKVLPFLLNDSTSAMNAFSVIVSR